jgi:ADP-ribose pyrophosphatase YjhB (NUDIX family)
MPMNAGATVAIIEGETILLTLREDFEVWCMPGGAIDEGETISDAARREVREETGLEVELTRLVGIYSRVGWHANNIFLFAARVNGGALNPDPREVLEARYFPFDALPQPQDLIFGHDVRLRDAISGVTGCVRTERIDVPNIPSVSRAQLYAQRDQSGLSRRDFYQTNIARLTAFDITTELEGINNRNS